MNIKSKEKLNKGWSSDLKYLIMDENDNKYLLRIASTNEYEKKLKEYDFMKKCAYLGVSMCEPYLFGKCDEGVYLIFPWIDGVDARDYIPTLNPIEQYRYGITAGLELKKIHSLEAKMDTSYWKVKFNNKIDRKISMYEKCIYKYEKGDLFINYINENRHLLGNRLCVYQHGDYHIGNMLINEKKELKIIDFDRFDIGDPWEEFNRIVWCAQASPAFASGMVDGYFGDDIPDEFWRLLALYICTNTLSSLPWAVQFGEEEIKTMINQANDVLSWYDDMRNSIPSWYKRLNK